MRALSCFLVPAFVAAALAQGADATPSAAPAAPFSRIAGSGDLVALARKVFPGVVTVRAYVRPPAGAAAPAPVEEEGWGESAYNDDYPGFVLQTAVSGFVASGDGDVLTCLHGIQKADGAPADLVDVEFQDRSHALAEVVATEPTVNLALLRCAVFPGGRAPSLAPLAFGDSDRLLCGQWTVGFGDPAGPEMYVAPGCFVARPSRDCYQELLSAFYVQVALTIPPQAYGGPLVNLDGEVVGILSPRRPRPGVDASDPKTGVEFALPSKIVAGLYAALKEARSFRSPWLGFSVMSRAELAAARGIDAFEAMPRPRQGGILIENVFKPSPASRAGIASGDFLVAFDGQRVFEPVDFQRYLYLAGIGRRVALELFRNGETLRLDLTIEPRPPEALPR